MFLLATFFPLPVLTLLGDVPADAPLSTLPAWVTALVVVVVPLALSALASAVASAVNKTIRKYDAEGKGAEISRGFRLFAVVLNFIAINLDKSAEQRAIANGTAAPRTADEVAK